jgi:aspartate racemase
MLGLIGANEMKAVTDYLVGEVDKLSQAGADFGLLAANTPHIIFNEIRERARLPLISIVEATCDAARAKNIVRAGLYGTRFTMQGSFYADVFSKNGIQLVVPDKQDQEYVHDKYMHELVNGQFLDETRQGLLAIADRLIEQQQIQVLILGGTELPLILRDETYRGIPLLDTTKIHVARALSQMLS